jgi:hypothetical protein
MGGLCQVKQRLRPLLACVGAAGLGRQLLHVPGQRCRLPRRRVGLDVDTSDCAAGDVAPPTARLPATGLDRPLGALPLASL